VEEKAKNRSKSLANSADLNWDQQMQPLTNEGDLSVRLTCPYSLPVHCWPLLAPAEGLGKLDTSLKRHTALLVKFRSSLNNPASIPAIVKEISQLSLEKYVEEAVGAVVEGLGKCKTGPETAGAVEVRTLFFCLLLWLHVSL
jgi:hypothetical protein